MGYSAQLLTRDVISIPPDATVEEAARLMRGRHVGCVGVVEDGRLVGVFTERDVLTRVVAEALPPASTKVSEVMTRDPVTVESWEPIERVFELLSQRRFRHVPVAQAGRPVGMVSLSDFAGVLREAFSEPKYVRYFVDYFVQRLSSK